MRGTSRRGSYRAIIRGVWAPPKLLAEAKSDENERTKAESVGSNTPWADGPANNVSGCGTSGPGYNNSGYIIFNVPKCGWKVLCAAFRLTWVHFLSLSRALVSTVLIFV